MAEEENKPEPDNAETDQGKKKSGKTLFLIIGGVVFLLIAIGAPIAIMTLNSKTSDETELVDPEVAKKQNEIFPEGFYDEDEFDEDEEPLGAFYPMETFVINLAGHKKYMRLSVQLEFQSRDIPRRFDARRIPVRDAVLKLLTSKAPEEVSGPDGREQLREQIKEVVNEELRKELIKKVYFTQFIIQ